MCSIGALAAHFFGYFHVLKSPVPDFSADVTDKRFGEYGRRDWYQNHVFWGADITAEMSYDSKSHYCSSVLWLLTNSVHTDHRNRVRHLHAQNDITITKVTHAGRNFAARSTRSHGSSVSDTKALGGWDKGKDSFTDIYDRVLPIRALIAAAMFDANQPASYFVPRAKLGKFIKVLFLTSQHN